MFTRQASGQIEAIHSMMASGHRSVYMERHTLFLWGLATAGLILIIPIIFSPENFPVTAIRAASSTTTIAVILMLIGYLDFRKIKLNRDNRDETISFIQTQITKVWWLLISLIVLINLAMHFFGGGYMFYSLLLTLMGLALYIHGLFSKQMLSYAGIIMIMLGLLSIGFRLPFPIIQWLCVFCFGLGWPILGATFNSAVVSSTYLNRIFFSLCWLAIIILPTLAIYQFNELKSAPSGNAISLTQFKQENKENISKEEIIALPAGTTVPLVIELTGDILSGVNKITLPMLLSESLDVVLQDGKLDGRFRISNGAWKEHKYNYRIRNYLLTPNLSKDNGPQVNLKLHISTNN